MVEDIEEVGFISVFNLSNKYKWSFPVTQSNLYYQPSSQNWWKLYLRWCPPCLCPFPEFHWGSRVLTELTYGWGGGKAHLDFGPCRFLLRYVCFCLWSLQVQWLFLLFLYHACGRGLLLLPLCSARSVGISATLRTHLLRHCDSIFSLQFCWARKQWVSSLQDLWSLCSYHHPREIFS